MDTLGLVLEYLKDLEECMDDGNSRVAKEMKLFDGLEHKSVVIGVGNQKFAIFTKAPLRAFGEPFMSIGFVHVSISDYGRKMVNDVNVEIHEVKFKADFVVLDYVNEGEPSIMFERDFLATTKSQVDFGLGKIRMNLTMFEEVNGVIDLLEEVGSSSEEVKSRKDRLPNPLIAEYGKGNKKNTITYSLQLVSNGNLKWKDFPSIERHTYYERLSKLQDRSIGVPRVGNWGMFNAYGFKDTLRNMMKLEYIYEGDGDVFIDYSWEKALSINDEVYLEWVLEFFSTMYFYKDVDKSNLMTKKCIWFRLCINKHILTLLKFAVVLGLFTKDEVNHRLFSVHFGKLEVDDMQFDHREYWTKVGKPTLTNHKEVLVKEPLMRIVHKLIVRSLESRGVNLDWIIEDHLYKHAPRTKESSVICAGHYMTMITSSLGYCVDDEIKKCLEPIDCEYWTMKMLAEELDEKNQCLLKEIGILIQAGIGSSEQRQDPRGLKSSWGDWNASLNEVEHGNV
nr:hypothetical protein [Tanacetum cinerariifolium]